MKTVEQLDQIVTVLVATLHRLGSGDGLPLDDMLSVTQLIESLTSVRARLCPYVDASTAEVQARD